MSVLLPPRVTTMEALTNSLSDAGVFDPEELIEEAGVRGVELTEIGEGL